MRCSSIPMMKPLTSQISFTTALMFMLLLPVTSQGAEPPKTPALYDLRADPFERASHESIGYSRWRAERVFLLVPAQAYVATWLASFKDFPPRQKPASFSLDQVMEKIIHAGGTGQ